MYMLKMTVMLDPLHRCINTNDVPSNAQNTNDAGNKTWFLIRTEFNLFINISLYGTFIKPISQTMSTTQTLLDKGEKR